MNVLFSKCSEAIDRAVTTKTYGVFYSDKNTPNVNIHIHECCEILFCISGGKSFFIEDRIYDVEDGDVFVINPYEAHKITARENCEFIRYVIQLHPSFLYGVSTEETDLSSCFNTRGPGITHKLSLLPAEKDRLLHIFSKFSKHTSIADDVLKTIAVTEVIAVVNKYFYEKNKDNSANTGYGNSVTVNILKYINANFNQELSLEIISKKCYMTVNELCRVFKKNMGTTVTKYITSIRITESKKMLKEGYSVSETAERCGFADYANFIRVFKKTVGIPPGQYKKSNDL